MAAFISLSLRERAGVRVPYCNVWNYQVLAVPGNHRKVAGCYPQPLDKIQDLFDRKIVSLRLPGSVRRIAKTTPQIAAASADKHAGGSS
jgi:hypothetical protein